MKRTFQCALAAAALFASSSAFAQDFGKRGQLAVSAERLFGFSYNSSTTSLQGGDATTSVTGFSLLSSPVVVGGGKDAWNGYSTPRVAGDYFIIDHLSLGGALGYAHWSLTSKAVVGNNESTVSGDTFTFAPRVGYAFAFNDLIGIWPRAGFTYRSYSSDNVSAHDLALTLEAPFTFNVFPHVVFWGGPTLDLGLTGKANVDVGNNTTQSYDFNSTEFGIQTGLLVYFDL